MERKIDIVFNSEKDSGENCFQIANGYVSETAILFEKEGVVAVLEAKGSVDLYNMENELIASGEVPAEEDGKQVYQEVCCKVEENTITISFAIVEWIDNYPHCDGEHDRWDTRTVGCHDLTFNL